MSFRHTFLFLFRFLSLSLFFHQTHRFELVSTNSTQSECGCVMYFSFFSFFSFLISCLAELHRDLALLLLLQRKDRNVSLLNTKHTHSSPSVPILTHTHFVLNLQIPIQTCVFDGKTKNLFITKLRCVSFPLKERGKDEKEKEKEKEKGKTKRERENEREREMCA